MIKPSEVEHELKTVQSWPAKLRLWARTPTRRLSLLTLVALALNMPLPIYLSIEQSEAKRRTETYIKNLGFESDLVVLKRALDLIDLCIFAETSRLDVRTWYCEEAVAVYQVTVTGKLPPNQGAEVASKRAFGMMKLDTAHVIRMLESQRTLEIDGSRQKHLDLLLSPVVYWGIVAGQLALLLTFYALLAQALPRHSHPSDAD